MLLSFMINSTDVLCWELLPLKALDELSRGSPVSGRWIWGLCHDRKHISITTFQAEVRTTTVLQKHPQHQGAKLRLDGLSSERSNRKVPMTSIHFEQLFNTSEPSCIPCCLKEKKQESGVGQAVGSWWEGSPESPPAQCGQRRCALGGMSGLRWYLWPWRTKNLGPSWGSFENLAARYSCWPWVAVVHEGL